MINGLSVGSQQKAGGPITLHFTYTSKNNKTNNNSSSSLKTLPNKATSAIELVEKQQQRKHSISNNKMLPIAAAVITPSTTTTTTTVTKMNQQSTKMLKMTQNDITAENYRKTYQPEEACWSAVSKQQITSIPDEKQTKTSVLSATTTMTARSIPIKATYANTSTKTKEQIIIMKEGHSRQSSSKLCENLNENTQPVGETLLKHTSVESSRARGGAFMEVVAKPKLTSPTSNPPIQRTQDQEDAFRRIEDVHNYAKLQHYSYSNEEGSTEEDDEDIEANNRNAEEHACMLSATGNANTEDSEEHVDVETVTQLEEGASLQDTDVNISMDHNMRPEHHARRPMNAFLIFCKRHRAIVKDRYRSLENRAITKILGDWWAVLDEEEKQCFTDLAQQNKDAFFNANPNFKWYKLPAPPLRTLATRPSNAVALGINSHMSVDEMAQLQCQTQLQLDGMPSQLPSPLSDAMLRRNYFQLADETQMGELSALLSRNGNAKLAQDRGNELQQALSETTQYLSAHMPNKGEVCNKRSLMHDSTSNSSEEDITVASPYKKLKSSRSCKGKIYQELVHSGQITSISKKTKCKLSPSMQQPQQQSVDVSSPDKHALTDGSNGALPTSSKKHIRNTSECSSNGGGSADFDLEEKIKELPALSLDAYLQRKRNIKKKKKKLTTTKKQRNTNVSTTSAGGGSAIKISLAVTPGAATFTQSRLAVQQAARAAAAAVGSQKRKARKESITRRDVSAIEQEVASILPLKINGYYYLDAAPQMLQVSETSSAGSATAAYNVSPTLSSASSTMSAFEQQLDVTSTSDLLILAEVAANRTELAN